MGVCIETKFEAKFFTQGDAADGVAVKLTWFQMTNDYLIKEARQYDSLSNAGPAVEFRPNPLCEFFYYPEELSSLMAR